MQQQTKGRTYQTDSGTATVPNLMGKLPMGDVADVCNQTNSFIVLSIYWLARVD